MLQGTVTRSAIGDSFEVRSDEGATNWVRVPDLTAPRLQVGERVQLTGRWEGDFFIADTVRGE